MARRSTRPYDRIIFTVGACITASAVHYYFPTRHSLIDALVVDSCASLAVALRSAYDDAHDQTPGERWFAVTRARRRWALSHPSEYLLIYGHTGWWQQ